jgi:hypothetical protein
MRDSVQPQPLSPLTFPCRLCGWRIETVAELFVTAFGITHIVCMERAGIDPLTNDERRRLARLCRGHEVAVCGVCGRQYRVNEMASDSSRGRHDLCPFCGIDLTPAIRQHIADCSVIRLNDPWWQANTRGALARVREVLKTKSGETGEAPDHGPEAPRRVQQSEPPLGAA